MQCSFGCPAPIPMVHQITVPQLGVDDGQAGLSAQTRASQGRLKRVGVVRGWKQ